MLESVKTNTDESESSQSRSGVFRRIMARDLYDVTKRVEELEAQARNPFSTFLTAWPHIALVLLLLIILIANILYFGHRIDNIEALQSEQADAQVAQLESKQRMIDELRQTLRVQATTLRTMAASAALAAEKPETVAIAEESPDASPPKPRAPMPASLGPGEVLLIIASTLAKEDAIDQARALEPDGYASEVILGKTGYYGVALGRFDFEEAKSMKSFMVESGVANSVPYLIMDESVESYIYP